MNSCTAAPSRRALLAAGALSTAALFGASAAQAAEAAPAPADAAWDEEFDVIVVGAGIAGLTTAITVAREGDGASCLLIEKCESANGCSPVCDGDSM